MSHVLGRVRIRVYMCWKALSEFKHGCQLVFENGMFRDLSVCSTKSALHTKRASRAGRTSHKNITIREGNSTQDIKKIFLQCKLCTAIDDPVAGKKGEQPCVCFILFNIYSNKTSINGNPLIYIHTPYWKSKYQMELL